MVTHLNIAQGVDLPHEKHHQETYNMYLDLVGWTSCNDHFLMLAFVAHIEYLAFEIQCAT